MVVELTTRLRDVFGCLVTIDCVPGNHGIVNQYAHPRTNYDNLAAMAMHTWINASAIDGVHFCYNEDPFKVVEIKGHRLLLNHHGTKHGGTPAMTDKVGGWAAHTGHTILVQGHWHQIGLTDWIDRLRVANGSLCGYDDLAMRIARPGSARQARFVLREGRPLDSFGFFEWGPG